MFLLGISMYGYAQYGNDSLYINTFQDDSLIHFDSTAGILNQTHLLTNDTLPESDSAGFAKRERLSTRKNKNSSLDSPVKYSAVDTIIYDLDSQYVFLYGQAKVEYEDITLEADYIRFNMNRKEVYSTGMLDSVGKLQGIPKFKQGSDEYNANILNYNFGTKKAYIEGIITEQDGGYLHSEMSKRQSNEQIHSMNNKYTTCDLEHPHFYIALNKAIIVPNKKIISGPAYMVVEDVPLKFLFLPFGFFPTPKSRSAGILFPTFGDEASRGFYLRDLGYYWPINDYFDLTLRTDIYTKGDWSLMAETDYVKKYKFDGNFSFRYTRSISGDRGYNPDITEYYAVKWTHSQSAKANPTQTFRASVDMSSTKYDKEYGRNIDDIYNNTKTSSISYTKKWDNTFLNTPFNINMSMNHSQNNLTDQVNMTFPNFSANSGNIYIIPKKDDESPKKFYHDIRTKYTASFSNQYSNTDTAFWNEINISNMQTGFRHDLPIQLPVKLFKKLPLSLSLGYKGYAMTKAVHYYWDENKYYKISKNDSTRGDFNMVEADTFAFVHKFDYIPSFNSITLNRNLYVTFQSTKEDSKVRAVRYVLMPKASMSITPPKPGEKLPYYKTVYSPDGSQKKTYSIYENAKSGYSPPTPRGKTNASGGINFSLDNNIEMKLRSQNDSVSEDRKVKLLDNLSFSTRYDIFADSLNWSDISFNTGTSLFKNMFSVRLSGQFDPYIIDDLGRNQNKFEINENDQLARLTSLRSSMSLRLGSKKGGSADQKDKKDDDDGLTYYDYFDIPWGLNISYNWSYNKPIDEAKIVQTLNFDGNIAFTKKWSFNFRSGYDLEGNEFTATQFNITRDLHCWAMSVSVIPFGYNKYFEFRINAVASMLKDLKYEFDRQYGRNSRTGF